MTSNSVPIVPVESSSVKWFSGQHGYDRLFPIFRCFFNSDKLPGFPLQIIHEQKNPSKDRTHINSFKWVCLNRHPNSIGLIASLIVGVSLIFGQTYVHSSLVDSQYFDVFVSSPKWRYVKRCQETGTPYIYIYKQTSLWTIEYALVT